MASNLKHEADVYIWLRERLLEEHESLKDDEVALNDTLEGITHLNEAVEWTIQSIAEDEELIAGIKARQEILNNRLGRIEHREEKKRALILETLQRIGSEKIVHPEFTVYRSKGRAKVNILDEALLPKSCLVVQPSRPDKKLIKEYLDSGKEVPGAELSLPTETLVIRRG